MTKVQAAALGVVIRATHPPRGDLRSAIDSFQSF